MKNKRFLLLIFILLMVFGALSISAQTTEFTYQGRLTDGSIAASGNYDLQFALFDDLSAGNQQGSTVTLSGVSVSNGIFTVRLDFGAQFTGAPRFLQIAVKTAGNPNPYTALNPRQVITSAPYAVRSLNSSTADTSANSTQLGGINANQYIQTNDSRLFDDRNPLPNSPNYIQNSTSQQASSNFNISGSGNANSFNSLTNYQIGGTTILSVPGNANVFVGNAAGIVNTTGANGTFVGTGAGQSNTLGIRNSFFGAFSGNKTNIGGNNAFFGTNAGAFNTTGSGNAFFGDNSGVGNTIGANNTLFGNGANVASNNLSFAAAIGAGATVSTNNTLVLGRALDTVQIPGSLTIAGTFGANIFDAVTQYNIGGNRILSNAGISNFFAGTGAGAANTTGNSNSFFGFQAGQTNQTGNYNSFFGNRAGNQNTGNSNSFFGSDAGLLNSSGGNNVFMGTIAGQSNTTGSSNSFFGAAAGAGNTVEIENSFFGYLSGKSNKASFNSFFGAFAGQSNTIGSENSFFGWQAGNLNLDGIRNSFFGFDSGSSNTAGNYNSFFGRSAGGMNIVGSKNSFFGDSAGYKNNGIGNSFFGNDSGSNLSSGDGNTFIGNSSGDNVISSSNSTLIGNFTRIGSTNLSNATAIGAGAFVTLSNSLVLGSIVGVNGAIASTNVGIGTTSPLDRLDVNGIIRVSTLGAAGSTQLCRNASNQIATCSSSLRYKTNINPFNSGLSIVKQLNPITFNWIEGGMADVGFGAENVARVNELLVIRNEKGEVEGVKYDRLSTVFVNAFKEQQAQIENQQKQIEQQQFLIDGLKKLVCQTNQQAEVCK
jgi:hypothetical protein